MKILIVLIILISIFFVVLWPVLALAGKIDEEEKKEGKNERLGKS